MARIKLRELNPTGSLNITGSLDVNGQTTFTQTDSNLPALIISGAMEIAQAQIQSQITSASLTIQNLGTLADRNQQSSIDLGGFF
jgi:hypothetical protein